MIRLIKPMTNKRKESIWLKTIILPAAPDCNCDKERYAEN